MQRKVKIILVRLRIMLADFYAVILGTFRETYCQNKTTNEVYNNADTRLCSST